MSVDLPSAYVNDDRRNPTARRFVKLVSVIAVLLPALLLGACGSDSAAHGAAPPGDLMIVEKNYRFETDTIQAPVGRELVVVIDNRDKGVSHNVRFPTLEGRPATKLETGPGYQTLKVRFDQPGTYPFVCDLHPTMKGTVVASLG